MSKMLLIGMVFALIGFASSGEAGNVDRDLVPNAATAIKVASAILETYMGADQFEAMIRKGPLKAHLDGEVWTVFSWPDGIGKEERLPNGGTAVTVMVGGSGPMIKISKRDAQVVDITFAK